MTAATESGIDVFAAPAARQADNCSSWSSSTPLVCPSAGRCGAAEGQRPAYLLPTIEWMSFFTCCWTMASLV